jgi:hypothetical protein
MSEAPSGALPPLTITESPKSVGASVARALGGAPSRAQRTAQPNLLPVPSQGINEDDDDDGEAFAGVPADLVRTIERAKANRNAPPAQGPIIEDGRYTLANFMAQRQPAAPRSKPDNASAPIVESAPLKKSPTSLAALALAKLGQRR